MPNKDVFAEVPGFLAEFERLRKEGFFEYLEFKVGAPMLEGQVLSCIVNASGCVPNNPKYATPGCAPILGPETIVNAVRTEAARHNVKSVYVKIESTDWPLYNGTGEHVVGSKGTRVTLSLIIHLKS